MKNLLLKFFMIFHKVLRKRATPSIEVTHPEPVEICWSAEETFQFAVSETKFIVDSSPYRILTGQRKRHVDAVQSHEIYLLLPSVKIPPAHGVVEGTIIQIISVLIWRCTMNLFRRERKIFRKIFLLSAPRKMPSAVLLQIITESTCHTDTIVSFEDNLSTLCIIYKPVLTILL